MVLRPRLRKILMQSPCTPKHKKKEEVSIYEERYLLRAQHEAVLAGWRGHADQRGYLCRVTEVSTTPNGRPDKTSSTYIRAQLMSIDKDKKWRSKSVKTQDIPEVGADVTWDGDWNWEFADDELLFLRPHVMEDEFGRDDKLVMFCACMGILKPRLAPHSYA
ncbi:hypothetical protein C0995_012208 [Termitomyces sp. Mi166|nr:hypothetical protein C0995_012208 [Termitomyces sp. Mi166\